MPMRSLLYMCKIPGTLVLVLSVILLSTPIVYAEDFTSINFKARKTLTDPFGGSSTSTNFSSVSSGGQFSNGESTSTSFTLNTGSMYFDSFSFRSQNWRWYEDESNETPSSPLDVENSAPSNIQNNDPLKLRLTITEVGNGGSNDLRFKLQYATSSTFEDGGYDVVEQGSCAGNSAWCYADGGGVDNAVIASSTLSDADPCLAGVGDGCGTHNESGVATTSFMHAANTTVEYEFTIKQSGAMANTVYFFRAVDVGSGDAVPLNTGESYPSLVAQSATLSFSIDGIPAASTTEGVTTAVDTTSTEVPFGILSIDTPTAAAQKLTVSTNASQGYRIFAYQRQGLLRDGSGEIPPVNATNASPSAWATACDTAETGCYGYHTGDDVLGSGDTTRFAADDKYAQFTSTPAEIAYSAGPVTDESINIVYRVAAHSLQDAGNYSTDLVYIIVPTF
ncbi:hypothetical protein HYT05_01455 [Candidatus Kaiserbacteria bacterium]|nr:hypothetical protein [Candidatus Kaiserbacteria bacterium]